MIAAWAALREERAKVGQLGPLKEPGKGRGAQGGARTQRLSSPLRGRILPDAIPWPIERMAMLDQPVADVAPASGARRNEPSPPVPVPNRAADRLRAVQPVGQRQGRALSAPIAPAGLVSALLSAFWRVDAVKPNSLARDLDRVPVDHRGAANDFRSSRRRMRHHERKKQQGGDHTRIAGHGASFVRRRAPGPDRIKARRPKGQRGGRRCINGGVVGRSGYTDHAFVHTNNVRMISLAPHSPDEKPSTLGFVCARR